MASKKVLEKIEELTKTVVQLKQRVQKLEEQQKENTSIIATITAKPPVEKVPNIITMKYLRSVYDGRKNREALIVTCPLDEKKLKGGKSFGLHYALHDETLILPLVYKKDNRSIDVKKYPGVVFEEDKRKEEHGQVEQAEEDDQEDHGQVDKPKDDEDHGQVDKSKDDEDHGQVDKSKDDEDHGQNDEVEQNIKEKDKNQSEEFEKEKPPTPWGKKLRKRAKRTVEDADLDLQSSSSSKNTDSKRQKEGAGEKENERKKAAAAHDFKDGQKVNDSNLHLGCH